MVRTTTNVSVEDDANFQEILFLAMLVCGHIRVDKKVALP